MAARGPQNGRRGLERGLTLGFWALPSTFTIFISMLQKVLDVEMIYNLRKTVWLDKPCHAAGSVGVCEPNIGLEGSKYKIPTLP